MIFFRKISNLIVEEMHPLAITAIVILVIIALAVITLSMRFTVATITTTPVKLSVVMQPISKRAWLKLDTSPLREMASKTGGLLQLISKLNVSAIYFEMPRQVIQFITSNVNQNTVSQAILIKPSLDYLGDVYIACLAAKIKELWGYYSSKALPVELRQQLQQTINIQFGIFLDELVTAVRGLAATIGRLRRQITFEDIAGLLDLTFDQPRQFLVAITEQAWDVFRDNGIDMQPPVTCREGQQVLLV